MVEGHKKVWTLMSPAPPNVPLFRAACSFLDDLIFGISAGVVGGGAGKY